MRESESRIGACVHDDYDLPIPDGTIGKIMRLRGVNTAKLVVERIERTRLNVLSGLLNSTDQAIKKYQGPGVVCRSVFNTSHRRAKNQAYDAMQLGSLLRADSSIGIWPILSRLYIGMSWAHTRDQIRNMEVSQLCDDFVAT